MFPGERRNEDSRPTNHQQLPERIELPIPTFNNMFMGSANLDHISNVGGYTVTASNPFRYFDLHLNR